MIDLPSVVIPAILLAGLNAKNLWDEHWEHWDHMPPLEERVQYPYMNIRNKAFPWGDGDKVREFLQIVQSVERLTHSRCSKDSVVSRLAPSSLPPFSDPMLFSEDQHVYTWTHMEHTLLDVLGLVETCQRRWADRQRSSWNPKVNYHRKDSE